MFQGSPSIHLADYHELVLEIEYRYMQSAVFILFLGTFDDFDGVCIPFAVCFWELGWSYKILIGNMLQHFTEESTIDMICLSCKVIRLRCIRGDIHQWESAQLH